MLDALKSDATMAALERIAKSLDAIATPHRLLILHRLAFGSASERQIRDFVGQRVPKRQRVLASLHKLEETGWIERARRHDDDQWIWFVSDSRIVPASRMIREALLSQTFDSAGWPPPPPDEVREARRVPRLCPVCGELVGWPHPCIDGDAETC